MKQNDNIDKITQLISNPSKFKQINTNPSDDIKKKMNHLIVQANESTKVFQKITGHFEPGYIYGNPKTHKNKIDPPLRPIISQIGTITYDIAKQLNTTITPYMNKNHMIESTHEFIQIARTVTEPKLLASLDVESLFTNVPVDETIEIIIENVYNHPTLSPPPFRANILRQLLKICTTETPFTSPSGTIHQQTDGVSMGTPLGPTFANFYMSNLENKTFTAVPSIKPQVYCRYVDDILLVIDNFKQLEILKETFQQNSQLNFTFEIETCKNISFLDTLIIRNNNKLVTTIYRKNTSTGDCLNYFSICPERYKISVIKNFLHRAYSVCSTWHLFDIELNRIKQILVNNNFPNYLVDKTIQKFVNNKTKIKNKTNNTTVNDIISKINNTENRNENNTITDNAIETTTVNLYYRNQMNQNYKQTEKELEQIVKTDITGSNNYTIKLLIYYKKNKLRNLFIKNNLNKTAVEHNVIYEYVCDEERCTDVHTSYIGHTTSTIKERFKQHSSIKKHFRQTHNKNITGSQMLPKVKILKNCNKKEDLIILEALMIKENRPIINTQTDDFNRTLKIFV